MQSRVSYLFARLCGKIFAKSMYVFPFFVTRLFKERETIDISIFEKNVHRVIIGKQKCGPTLGNLVVSFHKVETRQKHQSMLCRSIFWPNRVKRCGILQWRTLNPTTAYPPYPIMLNSACNEWHRILSIYFYISVYITICIYYISYFFVLVHSRLFLYAYCIHTYIRVSMRAFVISLTDSNGT